MNLHFFFTDPDLEDICLDVKSTSPPWIKDLKIHS